MPGSGNTGGRPNKIVVYDVALDRWSFVDQEVEILQSLGGTGYSLEGLDAVSASLDSLPASLDSRAWVGGAAEIAGFDTANRMVLFSGDALAATIETGEVELNPGHKTALRSFRSIVDGALPTVEVGTRNLQSDAAVYGSALTANSGGRFQTRDKARYHRFRASLSGNDWTHAVGLQLDRADAVRSGRR